MALSSPYINIQQDKASKQFTPKPWWFWDDESIYSIRLKVIEHGADSTISLDLWIEDSATSGVNFSVIFYCVTPFYYSLFIFFYSWQCHSSDPILCSLYLPVSRLLLFILFLLWNISPPFGLCIHSDPRILLLNIQHWEKGLALEFPFSVFIMGEITTPNSKHCIILYELKSSIYNDIFYLGKEIILEIKSVGNEIIPTVFSFTGKKQVIKPAYIKRAPFYKIKHLIMYLFICIYIHIFN